MTYDVKPAVEAGSLSSITAIAAHPPQHPGIPVQSIGHPLVLYIARIPGSRDVFLTPMKPKEKVVSAQDVQSSLYYVHVSCEEDRATCDQPQRPASTCFDASRLMQVGENVVKRKPVVPLRPLPAVSPPYPLSNQMPNQDTRSAEPLEYQQDARKPVFHNGNKFEVPYPTRLDLPKIPRRSLPSPPDERSPRNTLHAENVRLLRRSEHSDENNPYVRQYLSSGGDSIEEADDTTKYEIGSLTVIRRDPASSEQWNVASVHDPPVPEISSTASLNPSIAKRTKRGGAPLYLDITNPGYGQFIDKDRPESRTSTSTQSSDSEPPPEGTFRRRLYMPGSRYAEHGYGHRKIKSVDSGASGEMRRSMRDHASPVQPTTSPVADSRSKGYSFTSPWEGRCEFSTGATGKSLKCRHTFAQQGTVEVSELRFNLPTRNTPTPASEKRSSYFSRHSRLLSSDGDDGSSTPTIMVGENGSVDLSLGQEKAGGGFGGKQAKLGKLIIEPEGMKMLDLLVAANIGLWWRAYERA
ncbi:hypothetical protein LTR36_003595 [Oleoguttula mirabilis]|uniref:Uncharacterized protein n=1 Tax=Oleoguttula mirabilis TaxID=1507867 RepID=A0AAV9JIE2_9PEZI|nr:hypothetical protein LTR36_003595 [Oleoguttula mirabilis]